MLFAPMANVGKLQMDRDGVYIDIKNVHYTKSENLGGIDENIVHGKSLLKMGRGRG